MLGKQIFMIRKIDDLGRLVIPKEIIDLQGWSEMRFEFEVVKNKCYVKATNNAGGRKIDELRRLVIPINIRRFLELLEYTSINMDFYEDGLIISKHEK